MGDVRVLHLVATDRRRGAEMFAADLINGLSERGVDQRVAVLRDERSEIRFAAPTDTLESNGRRVPGVRLDLRAVRSLQGVVDAWRPDVVQVHGGEPLKHALAAARGNGVPVVYRRIGPAPPRIRRGPRRVAYAGLIRRAARVVAVADVLRRETIDLFGVRPDRVVTIPNAIDPTRMVPGAGREAIRRGLGIGDHEVVVVSLGALTEEKDPLVHVAVTERAIRGPSPVVHLLIGDGPLRPSVDAFIRDRNLGGKIRLLGVRSDVPDLLAAGDVMLLASRSEGLPGCLIEAGMAEMPAAAYALPGVTEVVVDGTTGLLARPGDPTDLNRCLQALVRDGRRRSTMGRAARDRCRSLFDIAAVAPRYLEVYRAVRGAVPARKAES